MTSCDVPTRALKLELHQARQHQVAGGALPKSELPVSVYKPEERVSGNTFYFRKAIDLTLGNPLHFCNSNCNTCFF